MNLKQCLTFLLAACLFAGAQAQDSGEQKSNGNEGRFSGNLQLNGNFFIRDSFIGAANTPQYDHQLYGAEGWLSLNYSNWGFDFGIRFDAFQNSNLLIPTDSYTAQGIGRWYVSKSIHKLGISAGYLYDVIGSGIIFRAYEERPLAIDQALFGIRLTYDLTPDWKIKAFTGRQRSLIDPETNVLRSYKSILRGVALDGFVGTDSSKIKLAPGIGIVGKTLDDASMNSLVAALNAYLPEDAFTPKYNTYAVSLYNTLTAGPFIWYVEGAWKSKDGINNPFLERTTATNPPQIVTGKLVNKQGSVIYTSLNYANKGLGITLEGKRTENFDFRTRPQEEGNRGLLHFIPPMTRVNTYRLLSRYAAATQFIGELAVQADVRYSVSKKLSLNVNFSAIDDLDGTQLYRELYTEFYLKHGKTWTLLGGVQVQRYNQDIYQGKPGVPQVENITPYFDFLYKFSRKKSIRFEGQYMTVAKQSGVRGDHGNWLFGLAEYSIAPNWSFTASNMFNISPGKLSPRNENGNTETIFYPRLDVYYTYKANRFSFSYVKQVEGIVCSGGICRLEPAFKGFKLTVNSTF